MNPAISHQTRDAFRRNLARFSEASATDPFESASWLSFLIALVSTAATLALRLALEEPLGGRPTLVIFTLPIMLSAYVAGWRGGLLATGISYFLASYFLFSPVHDFLLLSAFESWQQFFLALAGVVISALCEGLHRARRRADRATREHQLAEEAVRQSERKLQESEARFRGTFEQAAVGIAHVSVEGRFLRVNDKLCAIVGYEREELLDLTFSHLTLPEDQVAGQEARQAMVAGERSSFTAEKSYRRKDGGLVWINLIVTLERTSAGEPKYFISIFEEITARKEVEENLQRSQALLHMAGRVSRIGAWSVELPEGTLTWSDEVCAIHEMPTGSVPTVTEAIDCYAPEFRELITDSFGSCLREGKSFDLELQILTASGRRVWVRSIGEAERDETGVIRRAQGTFQDISDRKGAELALSESKRFAESIAENSTSIIYLFDLETRRTVYANRNAAESLGYSQAQMVELGDHFLPTIVHPEDLPRVLQQQALFAEVTDNRVLDLEFRVKSTKGEWRWIWTRETVFNRRPNGAAWQIMGTAQNVTERRRIEQELSAAKEAAEAANRAKSEFLANMSHEIRTPMNGILGMTDLVLDTSLTEEQRSYLSMAKTSGVALLGLINAILDFSKIEAGKLELEAIDFSLRDSLEQTLQPLVIRAQQKGLELRTEIADGLPEYLLGDPLRLRQILLNFTDNALKFTARGSIVVKVALEAAGDRERCLHFSIADTGIGVPPEKQQAIFEAFAQVDSSTTRQYGGTGLGLAIVSQIVEQMRGRVWMESAVGQGTTFHFTAWFGMGQAAPAQPFAGHSILPEETPAPTTCLRILLAEDNVINRALATAILARRGHSLVQAQNGREAVQLASAEPFDLILMDVQMPEMDGFEATRRIREREASLGRHTPIAAMTAHAMAGDRERCLAEGMDDYVTKPLQKAELLAVLDRVASGHFAVAALPIDAPGGARPRVSLPSGGTNASIALPVFSRDELLEQLDGDEALLRRMIALFQENTPRLLEDIRGSIAHGGPGELASSSHALLSSLGAFGADLAHRLARQLEARAHDENPELNERLFAALERATADIYPTLATFIAA